MRTTRKPLVLCCALALLVAACGSGDDDSPQGLISNSGDQNSIVGGSAGKADSADGDVTTTTAEATTTEPPTTVTEPEETTPSGLARDGYQRVEVEGFSFELPEDWLVIDDAAELDSITSSPEFAANLEDVDLDQFADQMDIVDLMALDIGLSDFSTNMNVIVNPNGGLSLDTLVDLNTGQFEQVGITLSESEQIDVPPVGEAWTFTYTLPSATGDIALNAIMWLDGDLLRQITVSAIDPAESQSVFDDIVGSIQQ